MFGPAVKKYLVLNCNDSPKTIYQAQGSFSGLAKCPSNPNKNSEVACTVKFSLENNIISAIRIVCIGPPALTASGNFVVQQSKNKDLTSLVEYSRLENIVNYLGISLELSNAQGLWALENAVDSALTYYNNLNN